MLNLKFIQDNPELVVEKLKRKNFDASEIVSTIIDLYAQKNKWTFSSGVICSLYLRNNGFAHLIFTKILYMYVLSVGERECFAEKGGVIHIVRTEEKGK